MLGLAAGIISGTLGLGSGTILIPAMVMFFGFAQKSAQGAALAVMVPMALLGALLYWHDEKIDVSLAAAAIMAAGALVGTVIGWQLARNVPGPTLKRIFAVYLLVIGLKMLIFPGNARKPAEKTPPEAAKTVLTERQDVDGQ